MTQTQYRSTNHNEEEYDADKEETLIEELYLKRQVQENLRLISDQVIDNLILLVFKSK